MKTFLLYLVTAFAEIVVEYGLPLRALELELGQGVGDMRAALKDKFSDALQTVSQEAASQDAASQEVASQDVASQEVASQEAAPQQEATA